MKRYLKSRLVQVGVGMLIVGSGPLFFIIAASELGLWPDPDPNPIGPGLLAFFTFWPAMICILVGFSKVKFTRTTQSPKPETPNSNPEP